MQSETHRIPSLVVTNHWVDVPLDYSNPATEQITIFAREVVAPKKEKADLPWLVYFQGGPGHPSPRPLNRSGWLNRACQDYRVLLLDQRGTGRSTPITDQTMARFDSPQAQTDYLKQFRADSIVNDAELLRHTLVGENERWSVLGQSYGGFCITHYLSAAPEGLSEAFITGGLPPLVQSVDDIYQATYQCVMAKNEQYYERYPSDVGLVQEIVAYLQSHEVHLSNGDRLSPRRFQQLGLALGMSDGFEHIHYLLEDAFVQVGSSRELSYVFLSHLEKLYDYETNPIFAILHEPIYCQHMASNWSAERVRAEYPAFEITPDSPVYFTGEMIYPWMFDEYQHLQPLKDAAELLAAYEDWPQLYNIDALKANEVPCAAAIYYNDMYVERKLSEETAKVIKGIKVWVTNAYEHNGLRADGEKVLDRLFGMLHGEV